MCNKKKGILTVVSGFSGAGKGALTKGLVAQYPEEYALSISATTRNPRVGEEDGREYFFLTKEAFEERIEEKDFIEYASYVGNYYGTPKSYVENMLSQGKNVILEIEIQGALKVKEQFPDTLMLFVTTPDVTTLKNRLVGRGTESSDVIASRLKRASEEAMGMERYDYLIVNDDLQKAILQTHSIIQNEQLRIARNQNTIKTMQQELIGFVKGE